MSFLPFANETSPPAQRSCFHEPRIAVNRQCKQRGSRALVTPSSPLNITQPSAPRGSTVTASLSHGGHSGQRGEGAETRRESRTHRDRGKDATLKDMLPVCQTEMDKGCRFYTFKINRFYNNGAHKSPRRVPKAYEVSDRNFKSRGKTYPSLHVQTKRHFP